MPLAYMLYTFPNSVYVFSCLSSESNMFRTTVRISPPAAGIAIIFNQSFSTDKFGNKKKLSRKSKFTRIVCV